MSLLLDFPDGTKSKPHRFSNYNKIMAFQRNERDGAPHSQLHPRTKLTFPWIIRGTCSWFFPNHKRSDTENPLLQVRIFPGLLCAPASAIFSSDKPSGVTIVDIATRRMLGCQNWRASAALLPPRQIRYLETVCDVDKLGKWANWYPDPWSPSTLLPMVFLSVIPGCLKRNQKAKRLPDELNALSFSRWVQLIFNREKNQDQQMPRGWDCCSNHVPNQDSVLFVARNSRSASGLCTFFVNLAVVLGS